MADVIKKLDHTAEEFDSHLDDTTAHVTASEKTLWNDKYTKSQTDALLAEKADADDVASITAKTTVNHTLGITAATKTCKEIYNGVDTTLTFNIQNPEGLANGVELLAAGELAAPPATDQFVVISSRSVSAWATATYYNFVLQIYPTGQIIIHGNNAELADAKYLIGSCTYIHA